MTSPTRESPDEICDPVHDTSYTGQIATLKRELAAARAEIERLKREIAKGQGDL